MKTVQKPLIIAHRGASALAPENTFAAFQKAIEDGADGIEFDVRLSKDGVPVVFHDASLSRLARCEGQIIKYSFDELQNFDVGSWFNRKNPKLADAKFSKEKIPSLAGLLDYLKDYKGLIYVELKCKKEELEPLVEAVCKIIKQTNQLPQIVLKSFKLRAIALAKVYLPEIYTASLFAPKILNVLHKKKHLLKKAEDSLSDEISLHYSLATKKLVQRARNQGLPTTIWTADNPRWVNRALNLGINAIITNNPSPLLTKREELLRGNSIFG
jgi:glycerophosphoryl diester phosphodiesterase